MMKLRPKATRFAAPLMAGMLALTLAGCSGGLFGGGGDDDDDTPTLGNLSLIHI